jgi:hypothetical protein
MKYTWRVVVLNYRSNGVMSVGREAYGNRSALVLPAHGALLGARRRERRRRVQGNREWDTRSDADGLRRRRAAEPERSAS